MEIKYPNIGVCGLSCRLCPRYQTEAQSRCGGCKSESRMSAGCPFITCALNKKGVEFCWDCYENSSCQRWAKHRETGRVRDSFKCYQKLNADIATAQTCGVQELERQMAEREELLKRMLSGFDEGRSKSYYCIAATVMETAELKDALAIAEAACAGMDIKQKAKLLHAAIDNIAAKKGYTIKLRK